MLFLQFLKRFKKCVKDVYFKVSFYDIINKIINYNEVLKLVITTLTPGQCNNLQICLLTSILLSLLRSYKYAYHEFSLSHYN